MGRGELGAAFICPIRQLENGLGEMVHIAVEEGSKQGMIGRQAEIEGRGRATASRTTKNRNRRKKTKKKRKKRETNNKIIGGVGIELVREGEEEGEEEGESDHTRSCPKAVRWVGGGAWS